MFICLFVCLLWARGLCILLRTCGIMSTSFGSCSSPLTARAPGTGNQTQQMWYTLSHLTDPGMDLKMSLIQKTGNNLRRQCINIMETNCLSSPSLTGRLCGGFQLAGCNPHRGRIPDIYITIHNCSKIIVMISNEVTLWLGSPPHEELY